MSNNNNNNIITNYKMFTFLSNIIKSEISSNNLQKKQETTPVLQQNKCLTHIIAPKEEIKQINK
jgi:hypothetical protein